MIGPWNRQTRRSILAASGFSCARALKFIFTIFFFLWRKRVGFWDRHAWLYSEIVTRDSYSPVSTLEQVNGFLRNFIWTLCPRRIFRRCNYTVYTDCRICNWPWKRFALGKDERSLFVNSNRCIPVKNVFGWSRVVFCACDVIQLFAVEFHVVRAMHAMQTYFLHW
jgi:hypothetical protein